MFIVSHANAEVYSGNTLKWIEWFLLSCWMKSTLHTQRYTTNNMHISFSFHYIPLLH